MSGRAVDAILVARDIYARNATLLTERLPRHPFQVAGSSSRGVRVNEPGQAPTLLQAIMETSAQMRGLGSYPITVTEVPEEVAMVVTGEDGKPKAPDRIMRSLLERSQASAAILVLSSLNICWNRFAICKEAAHTIMEDGQGVRATSVEQQIKMAYSMSPDQWLARQLTGEEFAYVIATELLLPWADREDFLRRHRTGEPTTELARSYWVPKVIVDMFFETPFGQISNDVWADS